MSPRLLLAVAVELALATPAHAQGPQLPPDKLARIKAATVYLKLTARDQRGSGSAFLVRADKDAGYAVTSDRTVAPLETTRGRLEWAIEAVFHSGTKDEWTVPATVLARDPERDLAVVRFAPVKPLPEPFALTAAARPTETQPVYVCGFPFGGMLAAGDKNPEVTIGPATVSSVRADPAGERVNVQLNGAINPGNSGGPVLTADGKMVGVARRAIRADGVGEAAPAAMVTELLDGRASAVELRQDGESIVGHHASFSARLSDPFGRTKKLTGWLAPAPTEGPVPADVSALPGAESRPLDVVVPVSLRRAGIVAMPKAKFIWVQASWVDAAGRTRRTPAFREKVLTEREIADRDKNYKEWFEGAFRSAPNDPNDPAAPVTGVTGWRGQELPPLAARPIWTPEISRLPELIASPARYAGNGLTVMVLADTADPTGYGDGPSLPAHDPETGKPIPGIDFVLDTRQAEQMNKYGLKKKVLVKLVGEVRAAGPKRPWQVFVVSQLELIDTVGKTADHVSRGETIAPWPNVPRDGTPATAADLAARPADFASAAARLTGVLTGTAPVPAPPGSRQVVRLTKLTVTNPDGSAAGRVGFYADPQLADELENSRMRIGRNRPVPVRLVGRHVPAAGRDGEAAFAVSYAAITDSTGAVVWESAAMPPSFPAADVTANRPPGTGLLLDVVLNPVALAAGLLVVIALAVAGVLLLRRVGGKPRRRK